MSQGDEESFFDLLSRFQSKRMDDQRCSLTVAENTICVPKSNAAGTIKQMLPLNNSNAANNNGMKYITLQKWIYLCAGVVYSDLEGNSTLYPFVTAHDVV
jgi:G-protein signaling modulator 2